MDNYTREDVEELLSYEERTEGRPCPWLRHYPATIDGPEEWACWGGPGDCEGCPAGEEVGAVSAGNKVMTVAFGDYLAGRPTQERLHPGGHKEHV